VTYGRGFAALAGTTFAQLRTWSRRQWRVAGIAFLSSFLVMGIIGETIPGASLGRGTPVEWWNYVTLVLSPALIGLIAATFVPAEQPTRSRRGGVASAGLSGVVGTVVMACPVCNPLAIPLFGSAGVLSFLAPERGLIALLSVVLLAMTLFLRLRTARTCALTSATGNPDGRPSAEPSN
jgi:hypothetical protein